MTTHKELIERLKPCPFCGHKTNAVSDNGAGLVFTVVCGNGSCRARGPWERCAGDAPGGWNTRTNDQRISTLTAEVEAMRQQGQAEGFAAAVQQLRDMGGMKPPPALWHAASLLADSLEQSRIPRTALQEYPLDVLPDRG